MGQIVSGPVRSGRGSSAHSATKARRFASSPAQIPSWLARLALLELALSSLQAAETKLLNASYDIARALFQQINPAFALDRFNLNDAKAREFVVALFKNVPVLDTGGRGATTTLEFLYTEAGQEILAANYYQAGK